MKSEDIQVGRTYKIMIKKSVIIGEVQEISTSRPDRPLHTYTVRDVNSGKVEIVRSPVAFLEEMRKIPEKDQLVKIVSGVIADGLSAKMTYRVKSVARKYAVIVNGKTEHKVLISDLRVVNDTPSPASGGKTVDVPVPVSPVALGSSFVAKEDGGSGPGKGLAGSITDEGDDCSDPTVPITETDITPTATTVSGSSNGFSGKLVTGETEFRVSLTDGKTLLVAAQSQEIAERIAERDGYNVRRTVPHSVPRPNPKPAVDPIAVMLITANDDTNEDEQCEAQYNLHRLAVENGYPEPDVNDAPDWETVARMARTPKPKPDPFCERDDNALSPVVADSIYPRSPLSERLGLGKKVVDDSPHLIVEARAGTGKTTTLIEGLRLLTGGQTTLTPSPQQQAVWNAMMLSHGKAKSFCFVAFNKSIATELQKRVPVGVNAMTMHSMGYGAVRNAFGNVRVENGRVGEIIAELLRRDLRELLKQRFEMVRAIQDLVAMCKMNLTITGEENDGGEITEKLDRLVQHYEIEIPDGSETEIYQLVPLVLERCKDVRKDRMIDYNDMIWLPVVLGLGVTRYDVLLVDEAQDLNRCQQALAKMAGRRLILVGDPKQAIYGFAGADSESMDRMYSELNGAVWNRIDPNAQTLNPGPGCTRLPLTVTRRCGRAIVKEANKIVPDLEAFETNGEGKVWSAPFNDKKSKLTEEEKKLNPPDDYTQHVRDGDFILCRVNAPLVSQCFRFLKMGRKAVIQGRDFGKGIIKLVDGFKASDVPDLVRKLSDWFETETKKENAKRFPSEGKLINLADKHDCLMTFTEGMQTVEDVKRKIESVFTDDGTTGIRFSSVHRAKGLEAKRVFLLEPEGAKMPHPLAKSAWQKGQEMNLKYVAITRAIEELICVT